MSGPKEWEGNSLSVASWSRASACFLCRREIPSLTGTGTKYDVNGCAGLSEFLLGEGFLALPADASAEEVCLCCHSNLIQLEKLLNEVEKIRNQMIQTAKLIKIRVRQSGQSESVDNAHESRTGDSEEEGRPTDSDSEDSELLSIHSEDHNPDPAKKANDAADKEDERFPSRSKSNPKRKPQRNAVQGEDSEEERLPSDSDEESLFERISVHSDASVGESSSSSADEDDDDNQRKRRSQRSKPNRRTQSTASATKTDPRSGRKPGPKMGPYPCEVSGCKEVFTNKSLLYAHFRTHDHRPFRCPSCNSTFSTPPDLKKHVTIVHHNGQRPFRCDVAGCGARFHSPIYLNSHRRTAHKGQVSPRKRGPKVGPYPCEVGGCKAVLATKEELYAHFRVHNHRPFRCRKPSCNAAFSRPYHLKFHVDTVHQPKGHRPFRCDVAGCGSRFSTASYLYSHHYSVHSGRLARTCDICGKRLNAPANLKKHRKLHLQNKYVCSHQACIFSCWSEAKLKEHVRLRHS